MDLQFPGLDRGHVLHETVIKTGLRELCPDIHFDLAACIGQLHPFIEQRQGVYYNGAYIVGMDRGEVPENQISAVVEERCPCQWADADKEDASIRYEEIHVTDPDYSVLYHQARQGKYPWLILKTNGRLVRAWPEKLVKVPGQILWLGWRWTFDGLMARGIPNITPQSLAKKFRVDMGLYAHHQMPKELTSLVFQD